MLSVSLAMSIFFLLILDINESKSGLNAYIKINEYIIVLLKYWNSLSVSIVLLLIVFMWRELTSQLSKQQHIRMSLFLSLCRS
jgi:hypothetical protein